MLNQKWYKRLRVIEISAAAAIPFLTGFIKDETDPLKIVIGLLGLIVVIITGIVTLYKFQENWIEYRTTSETLKHEKFLYITTSEPYNVEEKFHLLVQRVENLISKEKKTVVIELTDVKETLVHPLIDKLLNDKDVLMASYKTGHPQLDKPKLTVKTGKLKPETAIKKAAESLVADFETLKSQFEKNVKSPRSKKGKDKKPGTTKAKKDTGKKTAKTKKDEGKKSTATKSKKSEKKTKKK